MGRSKIKSRTNVAVTYLLRIIKQSRRNGILLTKAIKKSAGEIKSLLCFAAKKLQPHLATCMWKTKEEINYLHNEKEPHV